MSSPNIDAPAEDTAVLAGSGAAEELPRSEAYRQQRAHTSIDMKVLEKIATRAALSVPGVVRHSSGIGQFTGRRLPRVSVQMDPGGSAAVADIQIATSWPAPTVAVAQVTREAVGEWIEHSTGVPVLAVNVDVAAVVPGTDETVTVAGLAATPRTPEYTRVSATPLRASSPTVTRQITEVAVPATPQPRQPVHPPAVTSRQLMPVTAGRPEPARHVSAPTPRAAQQPSLPAPVHVTSVQPPAPPEVRHPVTPPATPVMRPRSPHSAAQPRLLEPIIIDHVTVTAPPPSRGLRILYDVSTPTGPLLRDVPTPRGLPTRTVPTPQGLEVTIFPDVRRHRRIPVTVDTSRRWRSADSGEDGKPSGDHDRSAR
ncbi:Asp23/Gls24 family envelope stress response protein [Corynebacterium glyciniphilum]|uniref:Asp23/Gls24 family envelope stress response protein n=1 Tax=Corynebacterium glyciniphilum TaxID=1404244 RepID=UPI003DA01C42